MVDYEALEDLISEEVVSLTSLLIPPNTELLAECGGSYLTQIIWSCTLYLIQAVRALSLKHFMPWGESLTSTLVVSIPFAIPAEFRAYRGHGFNPEFSRLSFNSCLSYITLMVSHLNVLIISHPPFKKKRIHYILVNNCIA